MVTGHPTAVPHSALTGLAEGL